MMRPSDINRTELTSFIMLFDAVAIWSKFRFLEIPVRVVLKRVQTVADPVAKDIGKKSEFRVLKEMFALKISVFSQ